MERDKTKACTWSELKKFILTLNDDELKKTVPVLIDDDQYSRILTEPFRMEDDIYVNNYDTEDGGTLDELQDIHGESFDISQYHIITPKRRPFLYIG